MAVLRTTFEGDRVFRTLDDGELANGPNCNDPPIEVDDKDSETLKFFRDVEDHLLRVNDHVESYDRLLTDILNAHLAQVSVRQNDDMRKISAWVAIAAIATAIAGIYGMNFHHFPELGWTYGYPFTLGLMLALCMVLFGAFKKSGWL